LVLAATGTAHTVNVGQGGRVLRPNSSISTRVPDGDGYRFDSPLTTGRATARKHDPATSDFCAAPSPTGGKGRDVRRGVSLHCRS
jgi:hypothetical protein